MVEAPPAKFVLAALAICCATSRISASHAFALVVCVIETAGPQLAPARNVITIKTEDIIFLL